MGTTWGCSGPPPSERPLPCSTAKYQDTSHATALPPSRPQAAGSFPSRPEPNIEPGTTGSDNRRPTPGPLRYPQRSTHHFPPDR